MRRWRNFSFGVTTAANTFPAAGQGCAKNAGRARATNAIPRGICHRGGRGLFCACTVTFGIYSFTAMASGEVKGGAMKGVLRVLLLAGIFFLDGVALSDEGPGELPPLGWLESAVDDPAISPEECLRAIGQTFSFEERRDLLLRLKALQAITRDNLRKAEAAKQVGNQGLYTLHGTAALYSHLARLQLQLDAAAKALLREKEKERKREEEKRFLHTFQAA